MSILQRFTRRMLGKLFTSVAILRYRLMGPPNVLLYGTARNTAILRAFGAKVGDNVRILSPLIMTSVQEFNGYHHLTIGNNCILGGNVFLDLRARIHLSDTVNLGPGVIIMTHNRYNKNPFLEERMANSCGVGDVVLKEGASIKAGALIVHGITVGRNAVVAGNAVVNHDVPDCHFVGGVPAKTIKVLE